MLSLFPGSYDIKSTFELKKTKKLPKHVNVLDALNITTTATKAPSIPTRFQSYGYEASNDGRLVLQEPSAYGYTGIKGDTVGPGDYEPTDKIRYKTVPTSNFAKVGRLIIYYFFHFTSTYRHVHKQVHTRSHSASCMREDPLHLGLMTTIIPLFLLSPASFSGFIFFFIRDLKERPTLYLNQ